MSDRPHDEDDDEALGWPPLVLPPPPAPLTEQEITRRREEYRAFVAPFAEMIRKWLKRPGSITGPARRWPNPAQIEMAVEPLAKLVSQVVSHGPRHVVAGIRIPHQDRNPILDSDEDLRKSLQKAKRALSAALRKAGEGAPGTRPLQDIHHDICMALNVSPVVSAQKPGQPRTPWKRWGHLRDFATAAHQALSAAMDDPHLGAGTNEDGVVCQFMVELVNFFWEGSDGGKATTSTMAKALRGEHDID